MTHGTGRREYLGDWRTCAAVTEVRMAGRFSTICAVLSIALLLYATSVVLIGRQINRKFINVGMRTAPPPARPADGRIDVLGVRVPLTVVWLVGASFPTWLIAEAAWGRMKRRQRERRGQCPECGHALPGRRGKCPGCDVWYER